MMHVNDLPTDLLEYIFHNIGARHLITHVSLVSRAWRALLHPGILPARPPIDPRVDLHRSPAPFWIARLAAVPAYVPLLAAHPELRPAAAALVCSDFLRRSMTGPSGSHRDGIVADLNAWEVRPGVTTNWRSGRGWAIEGGDGGPRNLASTYYRCGIQRALDLRRVGLLLRRSDTIRLKITVRVEVSTRFDCGGRLGISVRARDVVPGRDITFSSRMDWCWEEMDFSLDLPFPFVVILQISAQDVSYWAGHYGTKIRRVQCFAALEN